MPLRLKARALLYPCIIVPILALVVLAVALCLRNGELPAGLVNSRVVGSLAQRFGIQYSVGSLRIGCFLQDCRTQIDATGIRLVLRDLGPLEIENIHWCPAQPVAIRGLKLVTSRAGSEGQVRIGSIDFSTLTRDAVVRDIQISTVSGSSVGVRRISTTPLLFTKQTGRLKLDLVDVEGVDARIQSEFPAPSICQQTRSLLVAGNDVAARARNSAEMLERALARLHRNLLYPALILPAILFLLKVWSMGWMDRWRTRLMLAVPCVLLPVLLYRMIGSAVTFPRLIAFAFASSLGLAVFLRYRFYRRAPNGYQRWEPFTIDVLCFTIVLPLAAYGIDFGAPIQLPTHLEVARVNVADISVNGSLEQCSARRPLAIALRSASVERIEVELPAATQEDTTISIARLDIPEVSIAAPDAGVSEASASAGGIELKIDWKNQRIRDLGARLQLRAKVQSEAVLEELRKVRLLRPALESARPIAISVDLRATGPLIPVVTDDLYDFGDSATAIAVRGSLAVDSEKCDLRFAWSARLLSEPLRIVSAGLGDTASVDVQTIRTLAGSTLQIAGGSGRVSLAQDILAKLRVSGLKAPLGASSVRIESTDVAVSMGGPCSAAHQSIELGINGTQISAGNEWDARIERTEVQFNRRTAGRGGNPTSLAAAIHDVKFASGLSPDGSPQVSGSLPLFRLSMEGSTTSERIPRRLDGALSLSVSTLNEVLLRNTTSLNLHADIWEGVVTVPDQQQVIYQSIVSLLPRDVPLMLSLNARLPERFPAGNASINTHVHIPELVLDRTTLRDLRIDADTETSQLAFETGWNRVGLPSVPNVFCLDDIAEFDLSTEGDIKSLLLPERDALQLPNPSARCMDAPSLPTERSFRVQGIWPSVRLEAGSGFGVRIRDIGNGRLQKAELSEGRLKSLELESALEGIQTLDGAGDLGLRTNIIISGGSNKVTASLFGANDVRLADFALNRPPDRLDIDILPLANADELVAAFKPFLSSAGVSLGGVTPRARIERLHAGLQFEGDELKSLTANLDVGPGPLASITFSNEGSPLQSLELSLLADPNSTFRNGFRFTLDRSQTTAERAPVQLRADLSRLVVHGKDSGSADIQAAVALHTSINGTLSPRRPETDPLLNTVSTTIANLGRHVDRAVTLLSERDFTPENSEPIDFSWKFRVRNSRDDGSFLRLSRDKVGLRVLGDIEKLSWRRGLAEPSRLTGSGAFSGDFAIHENQLVLDAHLPIRGDASLGSRPTQKIDLDLPLLVVFSDELRKAPASSEALWDSDHYRRFWSTYRVGESSRGAATLVDSPRLVAGPVSVRQILLPLQPLQIAVGHLNQLELNIPFSGRTLFGSVAGLFQSGITWRDDRASIDSRFNLALRNIQAGAVGLESDYGHAAFVEDEFDGDISVRTDSLPINRSMFDPAFDFSSSGGLDTLSLRVDLHKSDRSMSVPGTFQLSTDTHVNTLNRILDRIIRDLQLTAPPQKLTYRNFVVDFRVDKGKVATGPPWLKLEGLRIYSSNNLDLEGNIRLHGGKDGETIQLRNLLGLIGRE